MDASPISLRIGGTQIAADVGGTFTDIALINEAGEVKTFKLPSTPHDFGEAVLGGISRLLQQLGEDPQSVESVLHGCTVATNAILERRGARVALITTKGFRDVLEMRRIRIPRLYDPLYEKPEPLAKRRHRFEVTERIAASGSIVEPLDEAELSEIMDAIAATDIEAIAVCFINSYTNPVHERRVRDLLASRFPDRFITASVDLVPEMREYERTSTTVTNAYVGPVVANYLGNLRDGLDRQGVKGDLLIMQSSGGVIDAASLVSRPAQIVECGPAAGVVGALEISLQADYGKLITFDMGGTTAKASIVEEGNYLLSEEYEVGGEVSAGSKLVNGGGYVLKLPAIDLSEVGAGGGSVVWVDRGGAIRVGPRSAGAVPGPVCYAKGGSEPTVTDANVVLGYLNPTSIAGGSVAIDRDAAVAAIDATIGKVAALDTVRCAYGIHTIANTNMVRAIKEVTTYRGLDPRDYSILAFGGNGGIHAPAMADALRVRRIIVPPNAGVFSAVGLLGANIEVSLSQAFVRLAHAVDSADAATVFSELEDRARGVLQTKAEIVFSKAADIRYKGQAFELTVQLPDDPGEDSFLDLIDTFETQYARTYGHKLRGDYKAEITSLRLVARVLKTPPAKRYVQEAPDVDVAQERDVYFGERFGLTSARVVSRRVLDEAPLQGPTIIEDYEGTTVIPPDWTARKDKWNNIVMERTGE